MKRSITMIFGVIILVVTFSGLVLANAYFPDIEKDLTYEYDFSQKYIVAGERVLNVTLTNNTEYNIDAIELEIRLKNAFKEVVSDWSSFLDPDLQIPANTSREFTLTLSRRNILGIQIENGLEKARYIEIRYKRILLDNGEILSLADIYPELKNVYGPFRVIVTLLNNAEESKDERIYNFVQSSYNDESISYKNSTYLVKTDYGPTEKDYKFTKLSEFDEVYGDEGIILAFKITNISEEPVEKNWFSSYSPIISIVDNNGNQNSAYALIYEPQSTEGFANERLALQPGITTTIVAIYDKDQNQEVKWIELFIDGVKYPEKFIFE